MTTNFLLMPSGQAPVLGEVGLYVKDYNFYIPHTPFTPTATIDYIEITYDDSGTAQIFNRWASDIIIDTPSETKTLSSASGTGFTVTAGDVVTITESIPNTTFRSWSTTSTGTGVLTGVACRVTKIPPMHRFTTDTGGTTAGNNFFKFFNHMGTITALPEGSFDLSSITATGYGFFYAFDRGGKLTSLPAGSFNTNNITSAGALFFSQFTADAVGPLTALPVNSFKFNNLLQVGNSAFSDFNYSADLTTLPEGSFSFPNLTTVGDMFCYRFNEYGALTALPAGSFNISNVTTTGNNFFANFLKNAIVTNLPSGSFNTENITSTGTAFFNYFNVNGALTQGTNVMIKNASATQFNAYFAPNNRSEPIISGAYFGYA